MLILAFKKISHKAFHYICFKNNQAKIYLKTFSKIIIKKQFMKISLQNIFNCFWEQNYLKI